MNRYTLYCTEAQTKKALELGAPIRKKTITYSICTQPSSGYEEDFSVETDELIIPTAEEMIGFILESGKGYSIDLSKLIREQGYKQGCLTFIDNCLK